MIYKYYYTYKKSPMTFQIIEDDMAEFFFDYFKGEDRVSQTRLINCWAEYCVKNKISPKDLKVVRLEDYNLKGD